MPLCVIIVYDFTNNCVLHLFLLYCFPFWLINYIVLYYCIVLVLLYWYYCIVLVFLYCINIILLVLLYCISIIVLLLSLVLSCSSLFPFYLFQMVTLIFVDLKIQPSGNCRKDKLKITASHEDGDELLGKLCGYFNGNTVPEPIESFATSIVVNFKSNGSGRRPGFHVQWQVHSSKCMAGAATIM